jgi:uncharacterized iron-regulated protein
MLRANHATGVIVNKLATGLLLLICASALAGCSVFAPEWRARHGRDHVLVGRIFDVNDGRFIDRGELMTILAAAEFVLLGERHDHPDQHRLQDEILAALLDLGRRPAVAFEVFDIDDGPAIERHLRERPGDVDGIAEVVEWREGGWPAWKFYRPIVKRAVVADLPLVATNLSREEVREFGRVASEADFENSRPASEATLASLRESEAGRKILQLGLDRPIDPAVEAAIAESIRATHCGHAPEKRVPGMILAQRARDAQMAETLASSPGEDGLVLIAGAGHVRLDRAAPYYLRLRLPEARVVSLTFREVVDGRNTPDEYAEAMGEAALPFDIVWFTPRISDEDACEAFRKALEKMAETDPVGELPEAAEPAPAQ